MTELSVCVACSDKSAEKARAAWFQKQEAQLSQRDRATLCVIEYFAKSLKLTRHSRSFEMTLLSRACVSPDYYFIETMFVCLIS